jgi:hypothetical protein
MKFKIAIRREVGLIVELETLKWEISPEDGARGAGIRKKIERCFYDAADSLPIIKRSTEY